MSSQESENNMDGTRGPQNPADTAAESCMESFCNMSLLDPPRWGWTALGGVSDLLTPHERARRKVTRSSYLKEKRKRNRAEGTASAAPKRSDVASSAATETIGRDPSTLLNTAASAALPGSATDSQIPQPAALSGAPPGISVLSEEEESSRGVGTRHEQEVASSNARGDVRFSALSADGKLDALTYHRGREGLELRDEQTGDLLCDVEGTDTNHNFEGPKLIASVSIQFPLEDVESPDQRFYKESLLWDLGDPQTQTPIHFATDLAQNFGLSFPQTLELAESIQEQLRIFVNDNCAYPLPVALQSDAALNRQQHIVPTLYGQAVGDFEEGRWHVASQKPRALSRSSSGILRAPSIEKLVSKGKIPAKRKREAPSGSDQVQKRLRMSSESEIREKREFEGATTPLGMTASLEGVKCTAGQKKGGRWGMRLTLSSRPVVAKVPVLEFPREVYQGRDIDPGTESIYSTLFTKDGIFVQPRAIPSMTTTTTFPTVCRPQESKENDGLVAEDGSVDYCLVCMNVGNLLCCDYCPRAFHRACIPADDPLIDATDDKWECPSCRREKAGLPCSKLDGSEYREKISAAFDDPDHALTQDDMQALNTISILYEMVLQLQEYDFGFMFRHPVDTKAIPNYSQIVKHPMDLGTIASNIINGSYRNGPLEDAVLSILKDIELVWHNCFIFNFEGSAVYRMAEVQRRRAASIREQSFDSHLSDRVKWQLQEYVDNCSRTRRPATPVPRTAITSPTKKSNRPKPRHKITATSSGAKGRPIAVLDPDTGRVVKMYATIRAVVAVADLLFNLDFPCEWERNEVDSSSKVRNLIVHSTRNPRVRLFGYRWVFFDDLEQGKIALASTETDEARSENDALTERNADSANQTNTDESRTGSSDREAIEMCVGESCFVFVSVDAALAYGDFEDADRTMLRNKLNILSSLDTSTEIGGRKWRKVRCGTDENGNHLGSTKGGTIAEPDLSWLAGVVAIKFDTLSSRTLVGFSSIDDAFQDWMRSVRASRAVESSQGTIETFRTAFLDGEQNIDGVKWKWSAPQLPENYIKRNHNPINGAKQNHVHGITDTMKPPP